MSNAALARVVDVLLQLLPARVHQQEGLAPAGTETELQRGQTALGHGAARRQVAEGVHPGGGRAQPLVDTCSLCECLKTPRAADASNAG